MSRYAIINYERRTPQAKVQRILTTELPYPAPPTPPIPPESDLNIAGAVRLDGALLPGASVSLSGSGVYQSNGSGAYVGTVDYGYSGAGTLLGFGLPNYMVSPATRTYTNLTASQTGQDYDITTQIWLIQGTITDDGTGFAQNVTNGTAIWSSSANGSYGFNVIGGWDGTVLLLQPPFNVTPGSYDYADVESDQLAQNFAALIPPLTFSYPDIDWSGWGGAIPDLWRIQVLNPVSLTWSDYDVASGVATDYTITDFGSYYRVYAIDPGFSRISGYSNAVFTVEPLNITGEIRLDGVPTSGVAVSFTGDGQGTSNVSGTYTNTLSTGYSGTAAVLDYPAPAYSITPGVRIYSNLMAAQAGQDFDIETLLWTIEGVAVSNGTGIATEITNGIATWNTASDGSYSYLVIGGWSGSTVPTYISDPGSYSYVSVQADFLNQDFEIPAPELFYAPTSLSWGGWAYTNPALWRLEVSATGSTAWTFYDYTAGTNFNYSVESAVGSYFRVLGATSGSNQITPLSNVVYAEPPDPGSFLISGALTDAGSPMVGIGVEVTAHGTVITDGAGTYSQSVIGGYSGTVIPHYTGGTFNPEYRLYTNVLSAQLNQDYVFQGTGATDCPVPSQLYTIPIDADPKNPFRNVIDPVNNLLWVIDDDYPNVYYIDVLAGTYAGSVDTGQIGAGSPCIAYDAVNQKIVITTYTGSVGFINPVTKELTYSNFVQSWPAWDMLAVDQNGTAYVCDFNNDFGNVYAVDGATEQLIASYPLSTAEPNPVYVYAICWAENINRLVLTQNQVGTTNRFYLFDPATGNFSASVLSTGTSAFNVEVWYLKATGHVLMSADGNSPVDIIDISNGTDATVIGQLTGDGTTAAPTFATNVTEDTCANTVFVNDNVNTTVWEYRMDGSYTFENKILVDANGLAHSRTTNLVYYQSGGTTYTLPYADFTISGSVHEAGVGLAGVDVTFTALATVVTNETGNYAATVPAGWSGTVTPSLVNGTTQPAARTYSNVAADYTNQDFEYFWSGYLFLTEGTSGFVWTQLPNDVVIVDGTIVQANGDGYMYTSTMGRTNWTLRGYSQDNFRIAYGDIPNRYVTVGGIGQIWSSEELSVWTNRTSGVAAEMSALTYGDGRFVAGCINGETTMSADGTNWTASSAGTLQITDIFYNGSLYVAVGVKDSDQTTCYTSTNGTDWTFQTTPGYSWFSGVYSPELGLNVIVGENGALATSPDAVVWTDHIGGIATSSYLAGIAWGNNRFVATDGLGLVWTSSNGTVWDYVMTDPYNQIGRRAAYWKNDWFVIVEAPPPG